MNTVMALNHTDTFPLLALDWLALQGIKNYSLSFKTELIGSRRWWADRDGREVYLYFFEYLYLHIYISDRLGLPCLAHPAQDIRNYSLPSSSWANWEQSMVGRYKYAIQIYKHKIHKCAWRLKYQGIRNYSLSSSRWANWKQVMVGRFLLRWADRVGERCQELQFSQWARATLPHCQSGTVPKWHSVLEYKSVTGKSTFWYFEALLGFFEVLLCASRYFLSTSRYL